MMDTKSEIISIWRECFPADSTAWLNMYFSNAYRQDCAMTLTEDNTTVCSLLLQPYTMTFHGERVGTSYVSGAATRPKFRNQGFMTRLMQDALQSSTERGDMLCTLIPANQRLYFYYSKLGFSTVFYNSILRYTSAHVFPVEQYYRLIDETETGRLYEAFTEMMEKRHCCIQHTRQQFMTIQTDNKLSGGIFAAIADVAGHIAAMAWAVPETGNRILKVVDILSYNEDAYNAVLRELQMMCPNVSLAVMERPIEDSPVALTPRGMARLLRPDQALAILARKNPSLKTCIRVTDRLLPDNNATYIINNGNIDTTEYKSPEIKPDLDITIEVLTAILFSSANIGKIMGIPSQRPFLSLMLD